MSSLMLAGSLSIPRSGSRLVNWSFTGVGDFAELVHVSSRDTPSVHWARAATHWDGTGLPSSSSIFFSEKRQNHAARRTGACWSKARVTGLLHVELDESCDRSGAVPRDSFHPIRSCPVINVIPDDNIRKSQHLFHRFKFEKDTSPCFWSRGMVSAEWMEVPAVWEVVEPHVKHSSCDTLKEWACSIMFLDGTGRALLQ